MKPIIKFTGLLVFLMGLISCTGEANFEKIERLNGYWEIKKVKRPNGKTRTYKFSETVDYIEIDSARSGFRKKLKANLSGHYKTTPHRETFTLKKEGNSIRIYYKTGMSEWRETLIRLKENEFAVRNPRGIIYVYQRFNGFLDDGEK